MALYVDVEKDLGRFRLSAGFEAGDEVLGILGASGCGKSMTLKAIAGIVKPDRGRIILDGTVLFDSEAKIDLPPQKRQVGLLFQNYALFPNMTVEKNLTTALRAAKMDRAEAKARAADMMERFYLTGLENHRPFQLSGGQQQRVALARILLTQPRLLMLDEPFSALDGYLRWKLELELMDVLKEFGGTVLFVSHSRDEIYRICQKACVMDRGSATSAVPVKTMFEEPKTLAACRLSGCKNYSEAEAYGGGREECPTRVYAGDWGEILECGRPVPEWVTHIGVRSHYIHVLARETPGKPDKVNVMECRITRIVEDVFHMVIMVKPVSGDSRSRNGELRLEMPKEKWAACLGAKSGGEGDVIRVWIEPGDILLLEG